TLTTPYDYYQYWINVEDVDVEKLLMLYTFLPSEQIAELTREEGAALREAKRVLAYESTKLTHGEEAAEPAEEAARALFGRGGGSVDSASDGVPTIEISSDELGERFTVAEAFVRAGLCSSRGDARRLAEQGGLAIDEERIEDVDRPFEIRGRAAL